MKTISTGYAEELINFAPTEQTRKMGFAEAQLHGAVAAYNMLARNRIAYVADEVGMGKTYVALGVMGLLRYQNPAARIVVIAPRENIQLKWIKELRNFVRDNWKYEDNRVKNLRMEPVRTPVACGSIDEIARTLQTNDACDLYLRSTTFSVGVKQSKGRKRCRARIKPLIPWVDSKLLRSSDPSQFRDMYGRVLNALIPDIDLLVIDESHNFKHGFSEQVSNRNRVLGMALGHPRGEHEDCPWYGHRVKRVLMLSATPFEYDYADLHRQVDVFGFGDQQLVDGAGLNPISANQLNSDDEELKRETVKRFLIRRVQYLKIDGKPHSKNMYRREWRRGGYLSHDEPMQLTDSRQRLVVGLMQKKVAEILGDRKFNNSFQIGMLSSFESFVESMARSRRLRLKTVGADREDADNGEDGEAVFDGKQEATVIEKRGIDSHSLEKIVSSYRDRFGQRLPHPKLDATSNSLREAFDTGNKALVFVRRVATVAELKAKLDVHYDCWIRGHMEQMLPKLQSELEDIFERYQSEKYGRERQQGREEVVDMAETAADERVFEIDADEGSTESFFSWFFRGEGPSNLLSGAAFQKNRLANVSSTYATIFEDDLACWLLGRPDEPLVELARHVGLGLDEVRRQLRSMAFAHFQRRTTRRDGYPRLYVFEAYQIAALHLLRESESSLADKAAIVLRERYNAALESDGEVPRGFPDPEDAIGIRTFFTELVRRPELREKIWPDDEAETFQDRFRRREQRRELISAMARLGASYVDLYLLAIRAIGSFGLRTAARSDTPEEILLGDYLELLDSQRLEADTQVRFNAYHELSQAAEAFDTLVAVNFPEIRDARLSEIATMIGRVLQHQDPVGGMAGGVNKRMVKQFRMPGYPLVLATTDVLQEGEDLHTFCGRVIHYGITWTPSAMEQRTGRVDRIGSLVQRNLDGVAGKPDDSELIQVHYPHLSDTVERLQVRRVLERLNDFLRLVHRNVPSATRDSRLNVMKELLRKEEYVPKIEGLLESEFPVTDDWLEGVKAAGDVTKTALKELDEFFDHQCDMLASRLRVQVVENATPRHFSGVVALHGDEIIGWDERRDTPHYREQPFDLSMRSQAVGDATLVRCVSPVGLLELSDDATLDALYERQRELGMVRVCIRYDAKHHSFVTTIEGDRLLNRKTTQYDEIQQLVVETVRAADRIEEALLGRDADPDLWLAAADEESE